MLSRIITLIAIVISVNIYAGENSLFEQANTAYEDGEFGIAIQLYDSLIHQDLISKELFYNLGNSYYKNQEYPKAILYYEKALKLSPGDEETLHNLKLAYNKISDEQPEKSSVRLTDWIYLNTPLSSNSWGWIGVLLLFSGFGALIYFVLGQTPSLKRLLFYFGIIFLIFSGISIYLSSLHYDKALEESKAIVLEPSIDIMTEPTENASVAFILHEGSKVSILQSNKEWYEIKFADGKIGWLEKTAVATI